MHIAAVLHAASVFAQPAFLAVRGANSEADLIAAMLCDRLLDFLEGTLPILRMNNVAEGQFGIVQEIFGRVTGQFLAAFADMLHGPAWVIPPAKGDHRQTLHQYR